MHTIVRPVGERSIGFEKILDFEKKFVKFFVQKYSNNPNLNIITCT